MHQFDEIFAAKLTEPRFLLADRLLRAGISGYPRATRRRLAINNLTGYLAVISSLSYAATFAIYDFSGLSSLVYVNCICALLYCSMPLWHRWGDFAAPLAFTTIAFASLYYFVSIVGRESGIQLNYLGASAVVFVLFGTERMTWLLSVLAMGLTLHVLVWFQFPTASIPILNGPLLLSYLYTLSAGSIMLLVAAVVWYAFRVAAEAEERSESLLRNMLPDKIALRLKSNPEAPIADRFDEASVLFADLVGFTPKFNSMPPSAMVQLLNEIFCRFDALTLDLKTEKIKTMGDAYMAVSGIPEPHEDHAFMITQLAVAMMQAIEEISSEQNVDLKIRIGIATGPITAGVIGKAKYAYDVWAPTVNLASRLESHGQIGRIHISDETKRALGTRFQFEPAAVGDIKGLGSLRTWFIKL